MNCNVYTVAPFERQAKRLSKKYPSLKTDLVDLITKLESQPTLGIGLGNNCSKIRFAITSKGKGKSGGARVITYYLISKNSVYLLSIYDKSQYETISDSVLKDLLKLIKT